MDAALMSLQANLKAAGDYLRDSRAARTSSPIFHKKIGENVPNYRYLGHDFLQLVQPVT
jgi:hypothetical protein